MRFLRARQGMVTIVAIGVLLGSSLGLVAIVGSASARIGSNSSIGVGPVGHGPSTLPGSVFVRSAPKDATGPDDLTYLPPTRASGGDGTLWTEYQNGVEPDGAPASSGATQSTLAGYDVRTGALLTTINVTGHVDGLTADPASNALYATANEDANSAFYVVHPWTQTVERYNYSPSPQVNGNGGTDSIALWQGGIYLSHANPNDTVQATVFEVQLDPYGHAARLYPVFWDDSVATFEPAGTQGHLALTDPDTNYVMPPTSPRFGGDLATISQGDGRLIFASPGDRAHPHLTQLNVTDNVSGNLPPIDGLAVTTSNNGTLYVVDASAGTITALSTAGWGAGTTFVGELKDNANPLIGTLDLSTGKITPLGNPFLSPKGMLFLPSPGTRPGGGDHDGHGDGGSGGDGGSDPGAARGWSWNELGPTFMGLRAAFT
ncbi:MAG TPA: hypothetical protein VGS23_08775 [Thermoplasmata archaeon]|nr:hypothetical protein [Thermoplasmata archaeon]